MAINPSLLVVDSTLQDYLVDKDTGLPLVAGVLTFYQDNSRTTLKNVYYQSGSPGAYTYVAFPNPITLSATGTVVDNNGNDTKIFYYPVSEVDNSTDQPYYVTVDSALGERQFTRQNWPFIPPELTPGTGIPTLSNLIVNNVFWRNIGSVNATNLLDTVIAPSQHDGFSYPDIHFIKDATGAVDTITFKNFVTGFSDQILPNAVTPEYYVNLNCTGAGSETVKYIQIPIAYHIDNLSGYPNASVTVYAQNVSGNVNNNITLKLLQYLGTGTTGSANPTLMTFSLSNSWQACTANFSFPSSQNLSIGTGHDDAWYLQIALEPAVTTNINIAIPQVYLNQSPNTPTNEFETYDEAAAIFDSPRTGDIRTSLNTFYPYGWVPMNGGTLANAGTITPPALLGFARQNVDTWPLFNLIWNAFKAYDNAGVNLIAQMYDSTGATTAYGSTAIADWTANKQLAITKSMGQVILGTVPVAALLSVNTTTFTVSNVGGNLSVTTANNVNFFNGMPVYLTGGSLPSTTAAGSIYYIASFNGTNNFYIATSFANAMAGTVIAYAAGSGTISSSLAGSYEGEYAHTQLEAELAAHHHPGSVANTFVASLGAGGNGSYQTSGTPTTITVTVASDGSSVPFNVTQPGTFLNMFMKL